MELRWIEDFLMLASSRSFSAAARSRHITQPAFSRRIKALEQWLGADLIDRSTYPVALTSAGVNFRGVAEEVAQVLYRTRDECRLQSNAGRPLISFAALQTLAVAFFPGWIKSCQAGAGPLFTRVQPQNVHDCVQALLAGSVDFLLCYAHSTMPLLLDPEHFPSIPIGRDRLQLMSVVDTHGKPLFGLAPARTSPTPYLAYSTDTFLSKMVQFALSGAKSRPKLELIYENSMAEALKAMVLEGHGVAWLPAITAARELEARRLVVLRGESLSVDLEIRLFRSNNRLRPDAERLWAQVTGSRVGESLDRRS